MKWREESERPQRFRHCDKTQRSGVVEAISVAIEG